MEYAPKNPLTDDEMRMTRKLEVIHSLQKRTNLDLVAAGALVDRWWEPTNPSTGPACFRGEF